MKKPFLQTDHIIITAPNLETGMDYVEKKLGVCPVFSGRHQGMGTHNALLSLGNRTYFEVIAPDPEQDMKGQKLWIDIPPGVPPRLSRWVAQSNDLPACARIASEHNIPLGKINPGSRTQPNGTPIHWHATHPAVENFDGMLPFFIDWGDSPHPADHLPLAGSLLNIQGTHPEAARISEYWKAFGIPFEVKQGKVAKLSAWIKTEEGREVAF